MNKYISFTAATFLLASVALPAFAQRGGLTGNGMEDGSANPVDNSMSMGNTPGGAPLIKANSPIIAQHKNTVPLAADGKKPVDAQASATGTHKHHHHHHKTQPAPDANANPMGAGR